jgi:cbb3-type cytochrome oxidase maturation protein
MIVLYFVLPLALILAGLAVWAFIRATRQGQFDDLDTPAMRVLFDDQTARAPRPVPPRPSDGVRTG